MVLLREGSVKFHVFRGSPVEMGRANGSLDLARSRLDEWLTWPHDFDHPYFRKNMVSMRREFPDFMERMEAYGAAAAPKFQRPDNPEHVNLFQITGLVPQRCSDCEDVRRFLSEYRISGLKGLTGTAVDARGNILGFELQSENIAFRESEDDMVLAANHWH